MANYRKQYRKLYKPKVGGWYKCAYCKKSIRFSQADIDHIWPRSKGGPDHHWNLVIACKRCNRSKGNKIDMRVIRGFLVKIFGYDLF